MSDTGALPILLDTHIWIWVMQGSTQEMSVAALDAINRAQGEGRVCVSVISVWEVGMLQSKGRLKLTFDVREWVRRALGAPGVRLAELSPEVVIESSFLPGEAHGDPADRILIATARQLGATLVTRDGNLVRHGQQGLLSVLDANP